MEYIGKKATSFPLMHFTASRVARAGLWGVEKWKCRACKGTQNVQVQTVAAVCEFVSI